MCSVLNRKDIWSVRKPVPFILKDSLPGQLKEESQSANLGLSQKWLLKER